jgi:phosphoenolpyruvate phosphomutase
VTSRCIARTEALIAGMGLDEAMLRARMYADAGADAVLVHSKSKDFGELAEFGARLGVQRAAGGRPDDLSRRHGRRARGRRASAWRSSPTSRSARQSFAIRDCLVRMRRPARSPPSSRHRSARRGVPAGRGPELKANEKRFLFAGPSCRARSSLRPAPTPQTPLPDQDAPRVMLEVKGKTILERQVESLQAAGIRDVTVVRGYKKAQVRVGGARLVDNDRYAETGELYSLFRAEDALGGPVVVLYGDIVFDQRVLEQLLRTSADVAVVVDRAFPDLLRAGARRARGRPRRHRHAGRGPPLGRAGRREPRAPHRARRGARGSARRVHRARRRSRPSAPRGSGRCAPSWSHSAPRASNARASRTRCRR